MATKKKISKRKLPITKKRITQKEAEQGLKKSKKQATEFLKDKEKTNYLIKDAFEKANRNKEALRKVWKDLCDLLDLVKFWAKGKYREVPLKTVGFAIAAIIYFVNPFDLIPDFILGWGYVDDATVLSFAINSLRDDIQAFRDWRKAK